MSDTTTTPVTTATSAPAPTDTTATATPAKTETTATTATALGGTTATEAPKTDGTTPTQAASTEFTPKLPDGFTADDPMLKSIVDIAKADGLKGEVAQKLVDLHVKQKQAEQERWTSEVQAWQANAQSDKEFGGEKFAANLEVAKGAIKRFGEGGLNERLVKILDTTGLGNEPDFIRFMYRVGRAFADDSVAGTTGSGAGEASGTEAKLRAMYKNSPDMFPGNQ